MFGSSEWKRHVISNDVGWRDYLMSLVHSNNVTIHATTTFDLGVGGGLQWRSRQQEFVNERIIIWQLTKRERVSVGVLWKCHIQLSGPRTSPSVWSEIGTREWRMALHCTLQLNLQVQDNSFKDMRFQILSLIYSQQSTRLPANNTKGS